MHPGDFHSNFRNVSQRFHRWQYKVFCTELWEKHRSFNSTPWHFKLDLFFCTRHLFAVTWRGEKHSMFVHYSKKRKKKKKKKSCYPCYVFSPSHRQCLTASCSSAADFTQFWQKKKSPKTLLYNIKLYARLVCLFSSILNHLKLHMCCRESWLLIIVPLSASKCCTIKIS